MAINATPPTNTDCKCRQCRPDAFPPESFREFRAHDNHFAVRFGFDDWRLTPYVNGDRQQYVTECIVGPDSWAVAYHLDADDNLHPCPCGSGHLCETVLYGDIAIEREAVHA